MNKRNWSALLLAATLAGCQTTGQEGPAPVEERVEDGASAQPGGAQGGAEREDSDGVTVGTASDRDGVDELSRDDPANPLSQRVIYFDYDSSELRPDALAVLQAHGDYLATHPERGIMIEGHTDERGSREYNLALGERRAEAVKKVLLLQGAVASQIESVSFGEEKPATMGHDEAAWQQNRRAELLYTNR